MSDSWEAFGQALLDESQSLARLNESALKLTDALVQNVASQIESAERAVDRARLAHQTVVAKRRGMQVRGFGQLALTQVCGYAPQSLYRTFNQRLSDISYQTTSIGITNANNKALILGGMERLMKLTSKLQRAGSEMPGTYKRRGFVPPPTGSVLLSSKC
ncbi:MAG: hypothetical protein M3Y21_11725 [Candidatus Eremiobacteraeota bacterium]|nr:hypothetical protein [Candidatus Eremiobacteraeota bacterium]